MKIKTLLTLTVLSLALCAKAESFVQKSWMNGEPVYMQGFRGCPKCCIELNLSGWEEYYCKECDSKWPSWQAWFFRTINEGQYNLELKKEQEEKVRKLPVDKYSYKELIGLKHNEKLPTGWERGMRDPSGTPRMQVIHIFYRNKIRYVSRFMMYWDETGRFESGEMYDPPDDSGLCDELEAKYPRNKAPKPDSKESE